MKLQIEYPNYLSIKDWKYFRTLEDDTNTSKMVNFISYLSGKSVEELDEYDPQEIQQTYLTILQQFSDIDAKFYPVIEIDGVLYGYSAMSKMKLSEYVDLERLAKNPNENLEEIMAILYRPIKKHSFNGITWNIVKTFKIGFGKVENLFKYYELEKYNSDKRATQADIMATIPVSFALGALAFFLAVGSSSLQSTQASLLPYKQRKKKMKEIMELISIPIGDGLRQFIISQSHPSLQSQGTKRSLT